MKKIFAIIAALLLGVSANAQYQLANSDFEQWETVGSGSKTGEEPVKWSSFLDGTGSMKSMAAANQLFKDSEVRPGSAGQYSARLISRSVFGIVAQGNLTNGCVNMGSMTATDANGNYNYINTAREDQSMRFTGHPDAANFWVRFKGANSGNVSILLTTAGYFQDPAGNQITAKLVAHATNSDIESNDTWTEYTVPFVVDDATLEPEYCLTNISNCATPGAGNAADYMYIDDIRLIYFSEATSIIYDGQDLLQSLHYEGLFDPAKLETVTTNGRGAKWTSSFDYNKYELTITVNGDDISENPTNKHEYVISFVKPNADLTSATQDGVDLLADASSVLYDASKVVLEFNEDVVSHTETFDVATCQLTIVMQDAAGNNVTRVIQFRKPAPAIASATWKGKAIDPERFSTDDIYDEAELVLAPNEDATLNSSFDSQRLRLVVVAAAPEGYEIFNKTYTLQFGLGDMSDPSEEALSPVEMQKGVAYYIVNKQYNLNLTDNDVLSSELTEWTVNENNTIVSENGKYIYIKSQRNWLFQESSTVTTSGTTSRELTITGDGQDGYIFTATDGGVGWSRTPRLSTTGTSLSYVLNEEDVTDACKWLFYDVEQFKNRQIRIEIYNEIRRAQKMGIDVLAYRQEYENNSNDIEALQTLLYNIRYDESKFVAERYTVDASDVLGSRDLSDTSGWNTNLVSNPAGQHWSGVSDAPYYEQSGTQWADGNWNVAAEKTLHLPAGRYVLLATGRSSALAEAYMQVGDDDKVVFPNNGDRGLGVDVHGNVNYDTNGEYANNGAGRGWEYRYLTFDLYEDSDCAIKIGGSAVQKMQWFSVSDLALRAQARPEMVLTSFSYDGKTYEPDADYYIDLTDVRYNAEIEPVIETLGYGIVSYEYDAETYQMTITVRQEEGINYGFEDAVYIVQFHVPAPALTALTYDGADLLEATFVDQYYNAAKLNYEGNEDAENITVTFDKETSVLTIVVEGYGKNKTYEIQFRDASEVSTSYTEPLVVTVNDEKSEPDEVTVTLRKNEDGTYDFELPNFILKMDGEEMPIGTIVLTGIEMGDEDGVNVFSIQQNVNIVPGDKEGINTADWYGPWLGEIPCNLTVGRIYEGRMYAHIDIDMRAALDQIIQVDLGEVGVTGVRSVNSAKNSADAIFDLQGRRFTNAQRGVNIIGGKKLMIK